MVRDLGELESEEHHVAAAFGACLADAGQQAARFHILRVLAVQQVRVDLGLGRGLFILGELAHHRGERVRSERRDLALVFRLKSFRALELALQRHLDTWIVGRREEIVEVPSDCFGAR